jgi:anti-anti-sigma factor
MKYSVEKQEEFTIFTMGEENLNSLKAPNLKSEFHILIEQGVKNLILNLETVKFVDSSGLSAILYANRLCSEREGLCVVTGIDHPNVKSLISISRLDTVLDIHSSKNEAVKYVMMHALKTELETDKKIDDNNDDDEK